MINRFKDFFTGYSSSGTIEFIVVGLGNPGKQYENTRHNMGFMAVDHMAEKLGVQMKRLKFKALCGDGVVAGKRVLFLKPSTYMNNSGESVRDAMRFYKVPPENLLVISDDISLDFGRLRIRRSGSDGGQKGLRSIIYLTGRDDFPRIRIGVGAKPRPDMELSAWVLSRLSKSEMDTLKPVFQNTFDAAGFIIGGNISEAMNKFN